MSPDQTPLVENTSDQDVNPTHQDLANAIRFLSADAVQAANSGHPGMPMGMADIAEVLWNDYVSHNPANPDWADRDRVVISNGHGSMLIYSVLHLTGYQLPMEELRNFRQLHSKTAGHPEFGEAPGVETTTGPLGQGLANAVGMALGEKVLANRFNRDDHKLVDHYTYVLVGDGCLMEGISHEVCSLAGTLGLGKLICLYDDNNISIDGDVKGWFTDDTASRFEAYGWQVIDNVDGHDADAIHRAIGNARANSNRPSLICCKTIIGYGSPAKQGKASCHGAPLGAEEIAAARLQLGWEHPAFEIPEPVYAGWDARQSGIEVEQAWNQVLDKYRQAEPELAAEFERRVSGELPTGWTERAAAYVSQLQADGADVATRKASQMALNAYGPMLPELIGGSADLAGSNLTIWAGSEDVLENGQIGNYINFGVREFGMTAIANGLALHGSFIPYEATFLVFSDYARNAVRMSALIPARAIHVYSHDSIGLGEDGPTHQPVEHVSSLRLIPNMHVWRPCDTVESAVAWQQAIERKNGPSSLVFTRQTLAHQARDDQQVAQISKGAYILLESTTGNIDAIIMATGSEIELAMQAARELAEKSFGVRVVSMPCTNVFDQQDADYRESVLPAGVRQRIAIEAGSSDLWRKYVGLDGAVIGLDHFGASAPADVLFREFGFTIENVVNTVISVL
jgi:transketolase